MKTYKWMVLRPNFHPRHHLCFDDDHTYYSTTIVTPVNRPLMDNLKWINTNNKFNKKGSDYESCS